MTIEIEHGNGELKQLLGIKRAYRKSLSEAEQRLKANFERDLTDERKRLKDQYLEKVVDTVFSETPAAPEKGATKTEVVAGYQPETVPAREAPPRCPECNAPVDPMDKFCSECAYPLKEEKASEVEGDAILGVAGRQRRSRRRP